MNRFIEKLSIRRRFTFLSAVLIGIMFLSTVYSWVSINRLNSELSDVVNHSLPVSQLILTAQSRVETFASAIADKESFNQNGQSTAWIQSFQQKLKKEITPLNSYVDQLDSNIESKNELASGSNLGQSLNQLKTVLILYQEFDQQLTSLSNASTLNRQSVNNKVIELANELVQTLNNSGETLQEIINTQTEQAKQSEINSDLILLMLLAGSVLAGVTISRLTSKSTQRLMNKINYELKELTSGNLAIEINGEDEVNRPLKALQDTLVNIVNNIQTTCHILDDQVKSVMDSMDSSIGFMAEQQQQNELIATATSELNSSAQNIANSVELASESATEADKKSSAGHKDLHDAMGEVQVLANQIKNASGVISAIEQDSDEINSFLDVISDIADQTNLLALNAAIEAARAGEQGRGFAVVADEVRALASKTQESTESIKTIIDKLLSNSKQAVQVMLESSNQSSKVIDETQHAGAVFDQIAKAMHEISEMSIQITTAATQQISVTTEIEKNANTITEMGASNQANAEEISHNVHGIKEMSEGLLEIVDGFKLR